MQSTDVAVRAAAPPATIRGTEFEEAWRVAKSLAMSGFFKDALKAEQAFAKILFGRDLGLGPTQAMQAIHIIEGRPELSANLQAQRVMSYVGVGGERYDYRVDELTNERCAITFWRGLDKARREVELGTSTFTLEDAKVAGLLRPNSNWIKWPRNMCFSRAVSNGVSWFCPEVMGGLRVYSEGEVLEGVEFGDAGVEGEDLSYLRRPERSAPAVEPDAEPAEAEVVATDEELAEAARVAHEVELSRIDTLIEAAADEDELAELSAQRDALVESRSGS